MRCLLGLFLCCPRYDREPYFGTVRLLAGVRALAPVLEQALDDTIHVGLLPAPNRRLRHPNLALDGIRPEAATRQQYNACVCDDLRVIRLCEVLLHVGTHGSIQVRRQKHQIFGSIDTERARRNRARRPRTPGSTA